ncbi:low-specificity L-threonine aldolase [Treponema sp.]
MSPTLLFITLAFMKYIDVRSDTVTWPTPAMRNAMAHAELGDDVYGDDPTVNELEALAAKTLSKEAALFVPSGTFGNQLALFTWCPRGTEVLLGEECHIIQHEAGGAATIAGVQTRCISAATGIMDAQAVAERIRGNDIHFPPTSLICMENAHSSGRVVSLQAMDAVRSVSLRHKIPLHLDGARLFNAAASLGVPASEIAARADSVMFCLSKGLCAPVGSMLAGPKDFIEAARRKRKIMGGGLRQAGILAAAGLIAIKEMAERVSLDHANARLLGSRLAELPGIEIDTSIIDINMVFFTIAAARDEKINQKIVASLAERGILINASENGLFRFVTHYWIDEDGLDKILLMLGDILNSLAT